MNKLMVVVMVSLLSLTFFGCPASPPVTGQETGKVIVQGNIFGDSQKSLDPAGMANLRWLMANNVDQIELNICELQPNPFVVCVQDDGSFFFEIADVPIGDYELYAFAIDSDRYVSEYNPGYELFDAWNVHFSVKSGQENKVNVEFKMDSPYPLNVTIKNMPGVYDDGKGIPFFFEDENGTVTRCVGKVSVMESGYGIADIRYFFPPDIVVKKISWTDKNGDEYKTDCSFSFVDVMLSSGPEIRIIVDFSHANVSFNMDFGLKKPPTLTITSVDETHVGFLFDTGDFFFDPISENWATKESTQDGSLYNFIVMDNQNSLTIGRDETNFVVKPNWVGLRWLSAYHLNGGLYRKEKSYDPEDILVIFDGKPLRADKEGLWHLN